MGKTQSKTSDGPPGPNGSAGEKDNAIKERNRAENEPINKGQCMDFMDYENNLELNENEILIRDEQQECQSKKILGPSKPIEPVSKNRMEHCRLIVAAIDFGTYGSGFAFCSRADYDSEKDFQKKLHFWSTKTNITQKPQTTILIRPDGKDCVSFGYEAEKDYLELELQEQKKHYLFRQFKMMLFKNQNLSESLKLKDITEKELPAVDVFAAVIRYFKESLEKDMNKGSSKVFYADDVHWVITVPAIWDLRSKEFMRKAAEKAGLPATQISLALEPEAASMYCRKVPVEISTHKDGAKQIASLQTGSKYLVVDLGGGTVDITAHEVLEDGGLKELHQASGGYYGGTCVNDEIMSFFKRLFGAPVLTKLKHEHPGDYLQLLNDIEVKKCTFKTSADQKTYNLNIPATLLEAYEEYAECKINVDLKNTTFAEDVSFAVGKMKISKELFGTFFQTSLDNIVKIIKDILNSAEMSDVNTILVVGGYAESPLMMEKLTTVFSDKNVVIPSNPSLCVLKGAIIFGFEPKLIVSRVCRYTYGIAKLGIWKHGDPVKRKLPEKTRRGLHWCDGVFDKHIEVGQIVRVGEFQHPREYFTGIGQEFALLDFYASSEKNPRFVDEPSCTCIGSFVLDLSTHESSGNILVSICFGGTELEVQTIEENTGREFKSCCNFLP